MQLFLASIFSLTACNSYKSWTNTVKCVKYGCSLLVD